MRVLPVLCNRNEINELRYHLDRVMSEWVSEVTGELMDRWVKDAVVSDDLSTRWRIERDIDEVVQELDSDLSHRIDRILDKVEDIEDKNEH
jgi:hypothetical protein